MTSSKKEVILFYILSIYFDCTLPLLSKVW